MEDLSLPPRTSVSPEPLDRPITLMDTPDFLPPTSPPLANTPAPSSEDGVTCRNQDWAIIGQWLKPLAAWIWHPIGGAVWTEMGVVKTEDGYDTYASVQEYLGRDEYTAVYLIHILTVYHHQTVHPNLGRVQRSSCTFLDLEIW